MHSSESAAVVVPANPGTIAVQCCHRKVRWVLAQRSRDPNKSVRPAASSSEYERRSGSIRTWQRRAMACTGSRGLDADEGGEHGAHGVRFGRHLEDVEVDARHGGVPGVFVERAATPAKNSSMNWRAC